MIIDVDDLERPRVFYECTLAAPGISIVKVVHHGGTFAEPA